MQRVNQVSYQPPVFQKHSDILDINIIRTGAGDPVLAAVNSCTVTPFLARVNKTLTCSSIKAKFTLSSFSNPFLAHFLLKKALEYFCTGTQIGLHSYVPINMINLYHPPPVPAAASQLSSSRVPPRHHTWTGMSAPATEKKRHKYFSMRNSLPFVLIISMKLVYMMVSSNIRLQNLLIPIKSQSQTFLAKDHNGNDFWIYTHNQQILTAKVDKSAQQVTLL